MKKVSIHLIALFLALQTAGTVMAMNEMDGDDNPWEKKRLNLLRINEEKEKEFAAEKKPPAMSEGTEPVKYFIETITWYRKKGEHLPKPKTQEGTKDLQNFNHAVTSTFELIVSLGFLEHRYSNSKIARMNSELQKLEIQLATLETKQATGTY